MRFVEAVIFDWAGTTVDFGSLAPVRAVSQLFRARGIEVTDAEVRADMGLYKKDHIRKLLGVSRVAAQWRKTFGGEPRERDVEDLFREFAPVQMRTLADHSTVIPGSVETVDKLRMQGVRIGSTTGYTRAMLDVLLESAQEQGYCPEAAYCPEDVGAGRPMPWMCLEIALALRIHSVAFAVKVGDTPRDMEEARNAGMWGVGVAASGNEVGLSEWDLSELPDAERDRLIARARDRLTAAGAHFVIDDVGDLLPALEKIDDRLEQGIRP